MKKYIMFLPNAKTNLSFGKALAVACNQSCIIYLYGDIGVGKTTLCRGFLRALGYTGNVKSPTYTLVESYNLPMWNVYHFDFYRLLNPEELKFIGIRDYFDDIALYLIEWPQHGDGMIPDADIALHFTYRNKGRLMQAQAISDIGQHILSYLVLDHSLDSFIEYHSS